MIFRLARPLTALTLIVVALAFAHGSSVKAGMIVNTSAVIGGSALPGASYSTFDELSVGTATQTTSSGLTVSFANGAAVVTGNAANQYAEPVFSGSNNLYFYPNPATAPPNGPDGTSYLSTGSGTITFSTQTNGGTLGTYFGLLWGSGDSFNSLTFNFADGSTSVTLTGADLGFPFGGTTTYFVNIITSTAISSVVATSQIPSFEIDNVAFGTSTVPEPASLVLMGLGLAGVGLVARQRRS